MFYFKVTLFYDGKESVEQGIVAGKTFRGAFEQVLNTFGEDELVDMYLYPMSEFPIAIIPNSIDEKSIKEDWGI